MATAYQHRPLSKILAPAADPTDERPTGDDKEKPAPVAEPTTDLPEKYKGKQVNEVIEMHQNSEKRLGQLQNEVGQLRGLVKDLSDIQRSEPELQTQEQEVDVSRDELLDNPTEAVRKIVQPEFERQEKTRRESAAKTIFEAEEAALMQEFGDMEAIVATTEFRTFAGRTPSRQRDLEVAATGTGVESIRAARRLLEDFSDFQEQTASDTKTEPTPVDEARNASTERGGTGAPTSTKPQIFESDVIALINSDPAKYRSPSFQAELLDAIKEGRFVKNT